MTMYVNPNAFWLNAQQSVNGSALGIGKTEERRTQSKQARVRQKDRQVSAAAAMTAQVRGRNQESHETNDGISMVQVAQEALSQTSSTLEQIRDLTQEVGEDNPESKEKATYNQQVEQLLAEVDRIASQTQYNQHTLISTGGWTGLIQIAPQQEIRLTVGSATQQALGLDEMNFTNLQGQNVEGVLRQMDNAITSVADMRASLGDMQTRFKQVMEQIDRLEVDAKDGKVKIQDVEVAKEATRQAKGSIQAYSDRSILAQANQQPVLAVNLLS
ncbi:flagellin [Magnetococcus sp. PR-3]|uniref:flagellin n=1 Tax=Magnetococcus sp. PR-3 TaxID=3120355 RepID=UPI002FCE37A5